MSDSSGAYKLNRPLPADAPVEAKEEFARHQVDKVLAKPRNAFDTWELYSERFEHFDRNAFGEIDSEIRSDLRRVLMERGIKIRTGAGIRVMDELVKAKDYAYTWPNGGHEDIASGNAAEVRTGNTIPPEPRPTPTSLPRDSQPLSSPSPASSMPAPFKEFQSLREMSEEEERRYETLRKNIANLGKQYSDADRYSGATDENLEHFARTFSARCMSTGIDKPEYLPAAFHVMLKGAALNYFLNECKGRELSIQQIYDAMRARFYTHKRQMALQRQWGFSTFKGYINNNPGKPLKQALDEYCESLRTLQAMLPEQLRHDSQLRDKIYNATMAVSACANGRAVSRGSSQELVSSLQASIAEWEEKQRVDNPSGGSAFYYDPEGSSAHYTDRRYGARGYGGNPGRYGGNTARRPFSLPRNSRPSRQLALPWRRNARGPNRPMPPNAVNKRCFVCKKPGCWSTNHPMEERPHGPKRRAPRENMNQARGRQRCKRATRASNAKQLF